jgi:WD40 repeat protein
MFGMTRALMVPLAMLLMMAGTEIVLGYQDSAPATPAAPVAQGPVSFKNDIARILQEQCVACHGPKKAEGGYRVDTFNKLSLAGDSGVEPLLASQADKSELVRRLLTEDTAERMPEGGERLHDSQIELMKRWVNEGASYDGTSRDENIAMLIPPEKYAPPPEHYPLAIPVTAVTWNAAGDAVVAAGYHELTIWNPADGSLVRRIANLPQRIHAIRWHPDGKHLVVAGGSPGRVGEVRVVNYETGEISRVLPRSSDVILDIAFSPDGTRLATAGADAMIRIYDMTTDGASAPQVYSSHSDWVYSIAWSADGKRLASASRDKTAKFFDIEKSELLLTYSGHAAPVRGVSFSPNGSEVYSVGADHKVQRWKTENAQKSGEFGTGGESLRCGSVAGVCWVAGANKQVRLYDMETSAELRTLSGHSDWVLAADVHLGSNRVVGSSHSGELIVWNKDDGAIISRWYAKP